MPPAGRARLLLFLDDLVVGLDDLVVVGLGVRLLAA
jgi:hypothetical protein